MHACCQSNCVSPWGLQFSLISMPGSNQRQRSCAACMPSDPYSMHSEIGGAFAPQTCIQQMSMICTHRQKPCDIPAKYPNPSYPSSRCSPCHCISLVLPYRYLSPCPSCTPPHVSRQLTQNHHTVKLLCCIIWLERDTFCHYLFKLSASPRK